MTGQDYEIICKGGKAVQLVLSELNILEEYNSEDIDILVYPKNIPYNENNIKNLAGHITFLVKWLLEIPETNFKFSIQQPTNEKKNVKTNPYIYKLSQIMNGYNPIMDVDFREKQLINNPNADDFSKYLFNIPQLKQDILFICPSILSMINDKIYYYIKYYIFKINLYNGFQINEPGYENIQIEECERMLRKFKKSIVPMVKGYVNDYNIKNNSTLSTNNFLKNNISKIKMINKKYISSIVEEIFTEF